MKIEYIVPFVDTTVNVLSTMASVQPKSGSPFKKTENVTSSAVTGIIGMCGDKVSGSMMLSFNEESILTIVSNMLGENYSEINPDVVDAVGELTNMISGGVRKELSELGLDVGMATPSIIVGNGIEITQLTDSSITVIPFSLENHPEKQFFVEANLSSID